MEKKADISLEIKQICFTGNSINIPDLCSGKHQIFYKEIVFACLHIHDGETGVFYEPEITEITENMEGEVLLYDINRCCWRLQTNLSGKTAGVILKELAYRAPYILLGGQPWFHIEQKEDFAEFTNMVGLMRQG